MSLSAETFLHAFQKLGTGIIIKYNSPTAFTIAAATDQFEELTGLNRTGLINQSIFTCFEQNKALYNLLGLHSGILTNVLENEDDVQLPAAPLEHVEKSGGKPKVSWWQTKYQKLSSVADSEQYILISLEKVNAPEEITSSNETYEHFKGLFDLAPLLTCVLHGSELRIQRMNQRLSNMVGRSLLQVQNEPISGLVNNEIFGNIISNATTAFQLGKTIQSSGEKFTVSNEQEPVEVFFDCIFEPVKDTDGKTTAVIFIGHEVSHYVAALDQVQTHEKQLELIYENVKDVIYMIEVEPGFNFRFVAVNNSFTKVTGLPKELIVGKYLHEVIPPESINLVKNNYITAIRERKTVDWNEVSHYPTGQKTGQVTITPVYDKNGDCSKMIGSVHDITDQTRHENEMQQSQQALERVVNDLMARNKTLEHFTYVISHHLRAPVANIMGLVKLFEFTNLDRDSIIEIINGLLISAEALDEVIRDLNDILSLRERNTEQQALVSVSDVVINLKISMAEILTKENATIELSCPDVDAIYTVESFLYSVMYNIISNSIKFRKRGIAPQISITCLSEHYHHVLVFKDNGKGLDMARYGKDFFGLYNRFDNSVVGKGLGMYFVKTQVEMMGGTISAQSHPMAGMEITITLPRDQSYLNH